MKERILQFLESERISPAEFADKIGVQRSSMSHILNGRNYPSASFIQKMLQIYPALNSRWLMIGDGTMNLESVGIKEIPVLNPPASSMNPNGIIKDSILTSTLSPSGIKKVENEFVNDLSLSDERPDNKLQNYQNEDGNAAQQESVNEGNSQIIRDSAKISKDEQPSKQSSVITAIQSGEKEIEQVLLFYTDKTFKVYRPS